MSLVMTKAALALKAKDSVEVVRFESHKPKKKATQMDLSNTEENVLSTAHKRALDLKKIRQEVVRFGMTGFDAKKKEEAKIALAVSLGAKPPKREYLNYKELMEKRKSERKQLNDEKQMMINKSLPQKLGKKVKKGNDVGHLLSSYGKVQKKELKKNDSGPKKKKKK